MRAELIETGESLATGARLARVAWRRAWAPLGVTAAGEALVLYAPRADLPPEAAASLGWTGLALMLLMLGPRLGALQRLAQGGRLAEGLGPGGLQWAAEETRLLATAVALTGLAGVLGGLVSVAALAAAQTQGPAAGAAVLAMGAIAAAAVLGRFAITLPADAAAPGARFARGWLLSRHRPLAPGLALLAGFAAPLLALGALQAGADAWLAAAGRTWTAAGALGGSALLAAMAQFAAAPLWAGALARLHASGLTREALQSTDDPLAAPGYGATPPSPDAAAS